MRDFFVLSYQASIATSLGAGFLVWDGVTESVFVPSLSYMCSNGSCRSFAPLIRPS